MSTSLTLCWAGWVVRHHHMPARARWVRTDTAALIGDQERLIAKRGTMAGIMDYVEGSVLTDY